MSAAEVLNISPNLAPASTWGASAAWIDDCGLLHLGRRWVALPEIEWRLLTPLVARFGMTVRRKTLVEAAWPDRTVKASALNVRIGTSRRRIEPLGLAIISIRGRGYVLDHRDPT
jgi:DNA-binding winged helix-turn-helix (wHTH) protein